MLSDAIAKMSELIVVNDFRDPSKIRYPVIPTMFAIMLAWMCGYSSAVKVEMFWEFKFDILKKLVPNFPDAKISHDTVNRILSSIIVDDLKGIMAHFSQLVIDSNATESFDIKRVLSLDGQTPCAAEYEPGKGFLELFFQLKIHQFLKILIQNFILSSFFLIIGNLLERLFRVGLYIIK